MKKTLTNLLSFSLFALLSSFSLFANSATFPSSESWRLFHKDTCGTLTTGHASAVAACASAGYALGGQVSASGGCGSNGTNTFACNSGGSSTSRRTQLVSSGVCPTNSTASGSSCTPNSGFSAINTDPSANGGNGSWSVVPAGQECSSTSVYYNPATGICDPVTANTSCPTDKPYLRYSMSDTSYYCHSTDSSGDQSDVFLLGNLAGMSAIVLSGAFTTLAACVASVLCALGVSVVTLSTVLFGWDFAVGVVPTPSSSSTGVLTAVINPSNTAPENDVLKVLPSGAMIPPANATPTADIHVVSYVKDGVTHNIDTQKAQSSYTQTSNGETTSAVLTSTPTGSVNFKSVSTKSLGTAGGQSIKQIKTQMGSYSSSNTNPNVGTSTQYQNESTGDITYVTPVLDGGGTGQTGTGTGDCSTYGCATESTLRQVRDELQNTRYDEAGQVQDDLQDMADGGLNEASDRIAAMLQTAIDDAGLNSLFDDVVNRLPIKSIIATNTASCSFSFDYLSKPYELSICNHQETIHAALAFFLFVAMSFGIVGIIFERPNGGE